jgi:DNA-binding MarR family transcriptional regulator
MAERRAARSTERDSVDECLADFTVRFPQIDPDVEGLVDRVAAIDKHVSRAFEQTLARHGLNHGEYKLLLRLRTVATGGQLSAGDLSRSLMLSSGGLTNRLDRLESAGLVRRVRDPRDRRGVLVELTAQGETRIDQAVGEQAARERDVASALTRSQLRDVNRLLRIALLSLENREDAAAVG